MSASAQPMKTFPKRLFPAVARARAGSLPQRALHTGPFLDSRPPALAARLELELPPLPTSATHATHPASPPTNTSGGAHGWPLALTSAHSHATAGPSAFASAPALYAVPSDPPKEPFAWSTYPDGESAPAPRERGRLHLDVGAYGIPKRPSRHRPPPTNEDLGLAVQVGEDAYFVRADAAGVSDGVGGWARRRGERGASASALFARRLMHFCAAELAARDPPAPAPVRARSASPPRGAPALFSPHARVRQLNDELEESLEELSEGLDVLAILQSAYEQTLAAHVAPPPRHPDDAARLSPALTLEPAPLREGSSTALLAVLDHARVTDDGGPGGAVLRIAHLGDSMGMLVRGDSIVWRSAEQWSSWNTPLQLGPRSRTVPCDAALAAVPVRADDVLILASDGLSDNVWDARVLAEVLRFRAAFLAGAVGRAAMAGMLSEALCALARRAAEGPAARSCTPGATVPSKPEEEVPFAKRAREAGREFSGGKADDISVVVAVISPS